MATLTKADGTQVVSATCFDLIQIVTRGEHGLRLTCSERWPDGSIATEPDGGKPGSAVFDVPILTDDGAGGMVPNPLLSQSMFDAAAAVGVDLSALPEAARGKMLLDAVRLAAVQVAKDGGYLDPAETVDTLLS